jgi:hypothetical protein
MFLLYFLRIYVLLLAYILPIILFLLSIIVFLGWRVARIEKWPTGQGLYFAFITATTVGYGHIFPTTRKTRSLSIIIAFTGLILTGILVALAFESLNSAADYTGLNGALRSRLKVTN